MSTKLDRMLATLETKPVAGHHRHHANHHHHRGALIAAGVLAIGLLVFVLVGRPAIVTAPKYTPPTRSLSSEVGITRTGVAQDFTDVSANELSDGLLQ